MKKLKKRFIVPAVVFILGMCALIGAIYVAGESQEQQNRTNAKLNAITYTERIYGELMEGIGVTDTLKQAGTDAYGLLQPSDGRFEGCRSSSFI